MSPRGDELDMARTIRRDAVAPDQVLAGRYRLEQRIGSGGMGQVWRAMDTEMQMAVAIKLLPTVLAGDDRAIATLKREAAVALRLSHPNICRLHTLQSDGEHTFLVMELVEGSTLEQRLEQRTHRRMPWAQLKPIAGQIAAAIDHAHALIPPVLHRDLKPANIMVDGSGRVKVLDFGVAREIRNTVTGLTGRADTAGTVQYMSPEQFRGDEVSPASDRYSFAAVLYECLAGRPLVNPEGDLDYQVLRKRFEPLEHVSADVNAMLKAGLIRKPAERPSSCAELVAMPDRLEQERKQQREAQRRHREPWPAWLKWCIALLVIIGGLWALGEWRQHQQRRDEAASLHQSATAQRERLAALDVIEQTTAWSGAREAHESADALRGEGEYRQAIEKYKLALNRYAVAEEQARRLAQQTAAPRQAEQERGWCFIATAAYGSYDASAVKLLRRFRDQVLMPTAPGRAAVDAYYHLSPPLARAIEGSAPLQFAVRTALTPVILLAAAALEAQYALWLLLCLLLAGLFRGMAHAKAPGALGGLSTSAWDGCAMHWLASNQRHPMHPGPSDPPDLGAHPRTILPLRALAPSREASLGPVSRNGHGTDPRTD